MGTLPEEKLVELTKRQGHIDAEEIFAIYGQLKPISPEFLLGEWKGGSFDTGHPVHNALASIKWAGKIFRSVDDVDPIVVFNDVGERIWNKDWGHAQIREVKYRGVVSAAMIYDDHPIIDYFRYVSENMVVGAMDYKVLADKGIYYFYLTKS